MGFATAVSLGLGNLVAEVEDAPEAFVEDHFAGEPRGRIVLSTEHSRGGDASSGSALRDGEQQQRLECCRLPCGESTTKCRRTGTGRRRENVQD